MSPSDPQADLRRTQALDIFHYALRASAIDAAMHRLLRQEPGALHVDGQSYSLDNSGRRLLLSIGKAAGAMATAFLGTLGSNAPAFEGIIAGHAGDDLPPHFRVHRSGHPTPDAISVEAARDMLGTAASLGPEDLVIVLLSGGGSSMLESPLDPSLSLEDLALTHQALVGSGAPIAQINAVRKHLSGVKGGRLAQAAAPARQLSLLVSDVPSGSLDALSSGPTMPDRSSVEEVRRIVASHGLLPRLPPAVAAILHDRRLRETPKPGDPAFARSQWTLLLDSSSLEAAARERAGSLGWHVEIDNRCDDWTAEAAADYLVDRLLDLRRHHSRVCLLSAGEVTVRLPPRASGIGGRNQHFALLCGRRLAGEAVTVLSAGSDGVDGNSTSAGALADGTTLSRSQSLGLNLAGALERFDAHPLLQALGDAVHTGPTGNNLRDLRVLLAG